MYLRQYIRYMRIRTEYFYFAHMLFVLYRKPFDVSDEHRQGFPKHTISLKLINGKIFSAIRKPILTDKLTERNNPKFSFLVSIESRRILCLEMCRC